jgi:hypothetical protein
LKVRRGAYPIGSSGAVQGWADCGFFFFVAHLLKLFNIFVIDEETEYARMFFPEKLSNFI